MTLLMSQNHLNKDKNDKITAIYKHNGTKSRSITAFYVETVEKCCIA